MKFFDNLFNKKEKSPPQTPPKSNKTKKVQTTPKPTDSTEFPLVYKHDRNIAPALVPFFPKQKNLFDLEDVVQLVVFCSQHKTILIDCNTSGKYLPFFTFGGALSSNMDKQTELAMKFLKELFSTAMQESDCSIKFSAPRCLFYGRFQHPIYLKFIEKYVLYFELEKPKTNQNCPCSHSCSTFKWFTITGIQNEETDNILGPGSLIYSQIIENNFKNSWTKFQEVPSDDFLRFLPSVNPGLETVFRKLFVSNPKLEACYYDFFQHCWPAIEMTSAMFAQYMTLFGLDWKHDSRVSTLFCAFDKTSRNQLSFEEFLCGIFQMEPITLNDIERIGFLFRYYDKESKGFLDGENLNKFFKDIMHLEEYKNLKENESLVKKFHAEYSKRSHHHVLTSQAFQKICLKRKPILTGSFVRSTSFILQQFAFGPNQRYPKHYNPAWNKGKVLKRRIGKACENCPKKLFLMTHVVYQSLDINLFKPVDPAVKVINLVFRPDFWIQILLKDIRVFVNHCGSVAKPLGLYQNRSDYMNAIFQKFKEQLIPILKKQGRCPNIDTPAYVIGDIHGNLEDLLSLESTIWRVPPLMGPKLIFLGDIVDRGKWSVECTSYILALKFLHPENVFILRGNHEVRVIQERYTYKAECFAKYGPNHGMEIWKTSNEIFDCLPIAATIDNSVFCCHGGLSAGLSKLDQLRSLPFPLPDPRENLMSLEILWSDPVSHDRYLELIEMSSGINYEEIARGYQPSRRGAGCYFSETATLNFLKQNNLQQIIRAHVPVLKGTEQLHMKRVTTVFSCSHYMDAQNHAAIIYVDIDGRMRELRVDTSKNKPAMDTQDVNNNFVEKMELTNTFSAPPIIEQFKGSFEF